jgi:hypothetical protein
MLNIIVTPFLEIILRPERNSQINSWQEWQKQKSRAIDPAPVIAVVEYHNSDDFLR